MPQNFIQRLLGWESPQQYEEKPLPDYGEVQESSEALRADPRWTGVRAIDFIPNSIREMGIVPKGRGPILIEEHDWEHNPYLGSYGPWYGAQGGVGGTNIRVRKANPEWGGVRPTSYANPARIAQHEVGHYLWFNALTDDIREQWDFLWNQHVDRIKAGGSGSLMGKNSSMEAFAEVVERMGTGVLPENEDVPSYFGKFVHASLPGVDLRGMHEELSEELSDYYTLRDIPDPEDREKDYQTMFDRIANTPPSQYDVSTPPQYVDPYHEGPALSEKDEALRRSDYEAELSFFPLHKNRRWNSIRYGPQGQELYNISQAKLKALGLPETRDVGRSNWNNWGIAKRFTREEAIANAMAYAQTAARQMQEIQNEQ